MISAEQVKELREMTGAGMMECKKVLEEANGDKEKAIQMGAIPETLKDVEFDFDIIKANILERGIKEQYRVYGFRDYQRILSNILFSIKAGSLPNRSWLIGAPKRFGKIEFVQWFIRRK